MKKILCGTLAFLLTIAPLSTFAEEPNNSSDVLLSVVPHNFAATVPTSLPIELLQNGQVVVATDAQIINNSNGPIKVRNIKAETILTGWSLANFSDDFTIKKVGSKELGLQFRGDDVLSTGECPLDLPHWPTIDGNAALALTYDGKLAAQRDAISGDRVANVVFTLEWDADTSASNPNSPIEVSGSDTIGVNKSQVMTATSKSGADIVKWESTNLNVVELANVSGNRSAIVSGNRALATGTGLGQAQIIVNDANNDIVTKDIIVINLDLDEIRITKQPNKTAYNVGDVFNPDGMEVTAYYSDGSSFVLDSFNYDKSVIAEGATQIEVTYSERGITKTTHCDINVAIDDKYVLATDADFSGTQDDTFLYIGTDKFVEIPHVIKGVNVTSYKSLFLGTSVEGVKSTNKNVTSMQGMFMNSKATSLDASKLDTSMVTNMRNMFNGSKTTNLDLSSFDTSNVTNMYAMFAGSHATNLDLSSFDTSNVTDMYAMFDVSYATNLDLSSFDTSNVTDMGQMFHRSQVPSIDLRSFDTSKVTNMVHMFRESQVLSLDVSKFDTSSVTNMSCMFTDSKATIITGLGKFDTSNVTNMSSMFNGSQVTSLDLSKFNTSRVTTMSGMFKNSQATILDLRSFNTSNVTNMWIMFNDSQATTLNLSSFNTSNVTNMARMFNGSNATSLDLRSFNTSKVTDMQWMFENSKATTGYARTQSDANKFNSSSYKPTTLNFVVK